MWTNQRKFNSEANLKILPSAPSLSTTTSKETKLSFTRPSSPPPPYNGLAVEASQNNKTNERVKDKNKKQVHCSPEFDRLLDLYTQLCKENAVSSLRLDQFKNEFDKLIKDNENVRIENAGLREKITRLYAENAGLPEENTNLQNENTCLKQENDELKCKIQELQEEINQLKLRLNSGMSRFLHFSPRKHGH